MRLFKNLESIAKEMREMNGNLTLVAEELRKLNIQPPPDVKSLIPAFHDLHRDLSMLAMKNIEMVDMARTYYAHEEERRVDQVKKSAKIEEELKPSKWDDKF